MPSLVLRRQFVESLTLEQRTVLRAVLSSPHLLKGATEMVSTLKELMYPNLREAIEESHMGHGVIFYQEGHYGICWWVYNKETGSAEWKHKHLSKWRKK